MPSIKSIDFRIFHYFATGQKKTFENFCFILQINISFSLDALPLFSEKMKVKTFPVVFVPVGNTKRELIKCLHRKYLFFS